MPGVLIGPLEKQRTSWRRHATLPHRALPEYGSRGRQADVVRAAVQAPASRECAEDWSGCDRSDNGGAHRAKWPGATGAVTPKVGLAGPDGPVPASRPKGGRMRAGWVSCSRA